jgi:general secretion pathway protein A
MYRQFYGLARNPFEISPDPKFYCPTPLHNEALASLMYGIKKRKGFVVTTGEVGTGKTLLIQCVMQWLNRSQIAFSHIFNPRLTPIEFLQYFSADLGLPSTNKNKGELLLQLNQYLTGRYRKGSTTVLIVDEGQLLDWEVLEEIRLLTNLETIQQKLLQIILIGQPELEEKLDSYNLRQLKQRIAFRCRLEPLPQEELRKYVARRLEVAGAKGPADALFPEATLARILGYSKGIPRLVNTLCESALITGYARQFRSITPEIVDLVAKDCCLECTAEPAVAQKGMDGDELLKQLFEMIHRLEAEKTDGGGNKQPPSLTLVQKDGAEA